MSNLLEYIKQQKETGLSDYKILQKAKSTYYLDNLGQIGGVCNNNFIRKGTILYYVSPYENKNTQNITTNIFAKLFGKNGDIFLDMFFTDNKEYAERFSNIATCNNRTAQIHEAEVIQDIKVFKINGKTFNRDIIQELYNADINGIEISCGYLEKGADIKEYYIRNPEIFLCYKPKYTFI